MNKSLEELQQKLGRAKFEDLTSTAGILIVLAIVVVVNLIAGVLPVRTDLTEHNLYTLSDGTKKILRELDTPVKIKFYATDSRDAMSADERRYAQAVRDRLLEFKKIGGKNLIFEQLNPEPDTNAEDAAELDGMQPMLGQLGEIYLGVVVSCIDKKEVIGALDPRREELLEYDVINAVSRVYRDERPKIKIMTGMDIAGGFSGNFQAPPREPWFFYNQLNNDYELEVIPTSAEAIEADTEVLIVLHPYDISETGEYAIDQYLLQGGTVVAMVDPLFYASRFMTPPQQNPMMGGMPPQGGPAPSSDLPTLFEAWGVEFQSSQVMADTDYQTDLEPPRGRLLPTLLSLTQDAVNKDNVVTSQLTDVYLPFAGGFKIDVPTGVNADAEALLSVSENNQLVASFEAEPQSLDQLRTSFKPTGEDDWYYAVRLTGTFKSAFPDGDPNAEEEEEEAPADEEKAEEEGEKEEGVEAQEGETDEAESDSLKESAKEGTVMLVADVDFIYDRFAVQVLNFGPGLRAAQPINQNLSFVQNLVEVLAGDERLISVRSRQSTRRPFTLLNRMQAQAQAKMQARIDSLEEKEREVGEKLQAALKVQENEAGGQEIIIDQSVLDEGEIEALRAERVSARQDLREARKELKRRQDAFINQVKAINIGLMPVLITPVGLYLFRRRQRGLEAR